MQVYETRSTSSEAESMESNWGERRSGIKVSVLQTEGLCAQPTPRMCVLVTNDLSWPVHAIAAPWWSVFTGHDCGVFVCVEGGGSDQGLQLITVVQRVF